MKINFRKYQGTGNDFVMLDNMNRDYDSISVDQIQFLCDRKLGIGGDGLIKISPSDNSDFEVEYYNADGSQSFCGNGARCAVKFAYFLGLFKGDTVFMAIDGLHKAKLSNDNVCLEMLPVKTINKSDSNWVIDTGSPHFITFNIEEDIVAYGKRIRYSDEYTEQGINVNTAKVLSDNKLYVETYERGVEDETLSCGTGVTAAALAYMSDLESTNNTIEISTKGGELTVTADKQGQGFDNIWLTGPALFVFGGELNLDE